jgi:hypothetical protein
MTLYFITGKLLVIGFTIVNSMLNRHFLSLNVLSHSEILYVDILTSTSTLITIRKEKL